jgi:GNAT superfamily N-acetyltransferase
MAESVTFAVKPDVTAAAICDLRAAVGWDRLDDDYPAALSGYWATLGGFDSAGALVAWCAILSDGVRHAVLLDVIVRPDRQGQGVGRELVARAVDHCLARGISIIHVDFVPEREAFYERCGFRIGLGGIYALPSPGPARRPASA